MSRFKKIKEKINVLVDINNFFGEYKGRKSPTFIFLALALAPCLAYALGLWLYISFKIFLVFEVIYATRVGMITIGQEKKKKQAFLAMQQNQYLLGKKLIRVSQQYNDFIEYNDGTIAFFLVGYPTTYFNENQFAIDLERFLEQLDEFEVDMYLQNVVAEDSLQDDLSGLVVYTDDVIKKERVQFYGEQDEYCRDNSTLYRYVYGIKTYKSNWKRASEVINQILHSDASKVFKELYLCSKKQVIEIASRDLYMFIELQDMMQEKYADDYSFGSRVLYYGEEMPDKYKPKKEYIGLENRRVIKEIE